MSETALSRFFDTWHVHGFTPAVSPLHRKNNFFTRFCPLVSYCGNDSLVSAGQYYDDNGFLQAQPVERGPNQARFFPSKA